MEDDLEHVSQWAILPAQVRYDPAIPANAKLLFAEIAAKTNVYGYCFASNRWLGERLHLTQDGISNLIKQLEQSEYIAVDVDPARENRDRRRIYITSKAFAFLGGIGKISDTPSRQNFRAGIGQTSETIENNKENINPTARFSRPKYMEMEIFKRIGDYCGADGELMLAYLGWAEMRQKIRKPIATVDTVTRANRKLDKLSKGDRRYKIGMLHKSTDASWTGLFKLKPGDEGFRDFQQDRPSASPTTSMEGYELWT